ncbi:MAG: hypothetical protein ACTHMV_18745 [Chitinophagaceae bacterium]
MNYQCSANELDPLYVIDEIFVCMSLKEILELFDQFCKTAQENTYSWPGISPGSLLKFIEDIEQLMEAAFLIWNDKDSDLEKKLNSESSYISVEDLPIHLNSSEYKQPFFVLEFFFTFQNINQWKSILHEWLHASLSLMTITEISNNTSCLFFQNSLKKLIEGLWLIKERRKNEVNQN